MDSDDIRWLKFNTRLTKLMLKLPDKEVVALLRALNAVLARREAKGPNSPSAKPGAHPGV